LLDEIKVDPKMYRFGVTKLFFKAGQLAQIEEMRERKIGEILITIQAAARGFLARQFFKRMTERTVAIKIIQRNVRNWISFKNWPWWRLFNKVKPMFKRRNFDQELKEKQKAADDLKAKLEAEAKSAKLLQDKLKEQEAAIADLNAQSKKKADQILDLEEAKAELEDLKADLERKLKKAQAEADDNGKDVEDLEKERAKFKKESEDLADKLDVERKARGQLEELKQKQAAELEKLHQQYDEASNDLTKTKRAR